MQVSADTLVRYDEEIIPHDEAVLEQREAEQAAAQARYDELLARKQELDDALAVVTAELLELEGDIARTRSTIEALRSALAAYKEENDCP
jgi:chromosome segregation ATPase